MEFSAVTSLVSGLFFIGGLGWKLNSELSKIRTMLEIFMTRAEAKWEKLDDIEDRVKNLGRKLLMKDTGSF